MFSLNRIGVACVECPASLWCFSEFINEYNLAFICAQCSKKFLIISHNTEPLGAIAYSFYIDYGCPRLTSHRTDERCADCLETDFVGRGTQ